MPQNERNVFEAFVSDGAGAGCVEISHFADWMLRALIPHARHCDVYAGPGSAWPRGDWDQGRVG